ncbi:putative holin-like toxin [Mammaliicoccus sciuri]|uniref:putative holin-like toxin n=1 Tax=Mammaliicoccus sciuri TaxID=1296 RepID=UPI002ADE1058|nr:putative holin-like toxin [Mammaliicoccus sciuri]
MVPISDALNLMFSFGSFIVLLLGLVIAIVKLNQKKNHLSQLSISREGLFYLKLIVTVFRTGSLDNVLAHVVLFHLHNSITWNILSIQAANIYNKFWQFGII